MGENGAGKSTLGKVLAGIHRPDEGELILYGESRSFSSPRDAMNARVAMVHQELAFCPDLSIAENLSMGRYPRKGGILLDRDAMHERAEKLLQAIGITLDVSQPMRALSTAQEQLVQIAAAVGTDPHILVFDEPTSSLAEPDAQNLFSLIEQLKGRGLTMIYVSHRMPELFRLCDKISVLRDGRYVGTLEKEEMTHDAVVRMMIGRSVDAYFPKHIASKQGRLCSRCATSPLLVDFATSALTCMPGKLSVSPALLERGVAKWPRPFSASTLRRPYCGNRRRASPVGIGQSIHASRHWTCS